MDLLKYVMTSQPQNAFKHSIFPRSFFKRKQSKTNTKQPITIVFYYEFTSILWLSFINIKIEHYFPQMHFFAYFSQTTLSFSLCQFYVSVYNFRAGKYFKLVTSKFYELHTNVYAATNPILIQSYNFMEN